LIEVQVRSGASQTSRRLDPARMALIICDMWDAHHCVSAEARVKEMAPHVDTLARALRDAGTLVIHCPSGCMSFYEGSMARTRAREAPFVDAPVPFDWNDADPSMESPLPEMFLEPGPCSCDSDIPCSDTKTPYPWTRQIASIRIDAADAVSDDGQEVYNLLQRDGIEDVLVAGVHTNLCVLGRPLGIRQLVYLGKRPMLVRDLTDAFHRAPGPHCQGTNRVVEHIEKYWCPSVTSDQFTGRRPFRFTEEA